MPWRRTVAAPRHHAMEIAAEETMANIERGEIDVEVNGKTYTLKLSMNAAVAVETKLKRKVGELLADAGQLNVTAIRELVFVLLQKFHKAEFKTVESVGDWIDDAGGIKMFFETLAKLNEINTPATAPNEGDPENPPAAQAGTSDDSTLRLVESA